MSKVAKCLFLVLTETLTLTVLMLMSMAAKGLGFDGDLDLDRMDALWWAKLTSCSHDSVLGTNGRQRRSTSNGSCFGTEKSIKSRTSDDTLPRRAKLSACLLTTPSVSLNWKRSRATLSPIPGICFSSSALAVLTFILMVTNVQVQGMSRHLSKMKNADFISGIGLD